MSGSDIYMNMAGILNCKSDFQWPGNFQAKTVCLKQRFKMQKSWESGIASTMQLKLSLYGLNSLPVSQDEVGNAKSRNLNHQYFCVQCFFLFYYFQLFCV